MQKQKISIKESPKPQLHGFGYVAGLAVISAVISGVCTHPIDTCKVQMQMQMLQGDGLTKKYKSLPHAGYQIIKESGFTRGIGRGLTASAMREASYSTIRLGAFEPIKQALGEKDKRTTPAWIRFSAGSLAGAIGATISQPIDFLKTRAQGQDWVPLSQLTRQVYNQNGIKGFYDGLLASQTRAAAIGAAYMGSYDFTKQKMLKYKMKDDMKT